MNRRTFALIGLLLCSTAYAAGTSIWNATDRGAVAATDRLPVATSSSSGPLYVTPLTLQSYLLSGSATTEVLANNAGSFDGDSGFTFNATNNTVDLGGATLTASDPVLDLSQTWNSGATTFTGAKLNVTDTASAAGSELLALQVGGTNKFSIAKSGQLNLAYTAVGAGTGQLIFNPSTGIGIMLGVGSSGSALYVADSTTGASSMVLRSSALHFGSNGKLGWSTTSNNPTTTLDTYIERGAAGTLVQRNGTNAQTLQVFDTYTDASNYGRLALNTSLTGDWVQIAAETAGTGGDNYGIALSPTGTGAISAHVPDSTAAGGNARGSNAVDWQQSRTAAAQAATGGSSVISGGNSNTASGTFSAISGGNGNTASSAGSVVSGGYTNSATGTQSWVPGGLDGLTRGLSGAGAYSAGKRAAIGDAQVILQPVRRTTTDATPVSLATDGTPAATTVMVLPSDSTATCRAMVTANSTAAGVVSMAGFTADAIVKNDSSTMTISGGTCTAIGTADAALTTATCALVANGTLDSIEMQVTGVAATTVYWVAEVKCVQAL